MVNSKIYYKSGKIGAAVSITVPEAPQYRHMEVFNGLADCKEGNL